MTDAEDWAQVFRLLEGERQRLARKGAPLPPLVESARLIASGSVSSRQAPSPEPLRRNGSDAVPVLLLSFEDVAARLGRSRSTVERMARSGELPTVLVGGRPGVRPADLEEFINSRPLQRDAGGVEIT